MLLTQFSFTQLLPGPVIHISAIAGVSTTAATVAACLPAAAAACLQSQPLSCKLLRPKLKTEAKA